MTFLTRRHLSHESYSSNIYSMVYYRRSRRRGHGKCYNHNLTLSLNPQRYSVSSGQGREGRLQSMLEGAHSGVLTQEAPLSAVCHL